MEITGKVIKTLPLQSGEGKNGIWKKQEYVIETINCRIIKFGNLKKIEHGFLLKIAD